MVEQYKMGASGRGQTELRGKPVDFNEGGLRNSDGFARGKLVMTFRCVGRPISSSETT